MKKIWKWAGLVIFVPAVTAVLVWQATIGVPVDVRRMRPETFAVRIVEEGVVEADVQYTVYSRFRDRVVSVLVEEGQRVEKGQPLLVLDVREMEYAEAEIRGRLEELAGEEMKLTETPGEAEIAERKLAIEQAKAGHAAAERRYERIERLHRTGAATDEEYNQARDALTDAEYDLKRSRKALQVLHESYEPPPGSYEAIAGRRAAYEAELGRTRFLAGEYRIYSPADGVVGRLRPEENELVDPQVPLLTVFRDDRMKVEVDVLAREVFELEVGMPVMMELDLRDRDIEFPGTIEKIAPQADKDISPLGLEERRVKVTVRPEIPQDVGIGPGREVDATFITQEVPDSMVVPKRSLFTYAGEDAVFVAEDGRARVRRVTTGVESRREQVIEQGLRAGDLVILDPRIDGLRDGARVRVVQE